MSLIDYFYSRLFPSYPWCNNVHIRNWFEWEKKFHSYDAYFGGHSGALRNVGVNEEYFPENAGIWNIPYIYLPLSEYGNLCATVSDISEEIRNQIIVKRGGCECVIFFVHPSAWEKVLSHIDKTLETVDSRSSEFFATPTSSIRSLVVWHRSQKRKPFVVKTSVFSVSYGFHRHLDWEGVRIQFSRREMLQKIGTENILKHGLRLMDEVAISGLKLKQPIIIERPEFLGPGQPAEIFELGNLVREIPADVIRGEKRLIPCTAYVSAERPNETFIEFIAKQSKRDVVDSLLESLLNPSLKALTGLMSDFGVVLEPHAQNVLIETDSDFRSTGRVCYRDLGAVWFDPLRCFLRAPHLLKAFPEHNKNRTMSLQEAQRSRDGTVRSLAHHFMFCNFVRALVVLVKRNQISDPKAKELSFAAFERCAEFLSSYHGWTSRPSLRSPYDRKLAMDAATPIFLPTIADSLRLLTHHEVESLALPINKQAAETAVVRDILQTAEFAENETFDWYAHENGFVASQGDLVVALQVT